ncbi:thiol-disulfide oxidoreductase DCC family protein [Haloarchaeobius sp. HRN-SO-5]|uniref:thiol-disulfide oxidoreductase DCC family protein n=1 Tax=Haloarchaeobius sp. HRN-SO-5 TaxID=3446118 RepID=UPI003EBD4DE6
MEQRPTIVYDDDCGFCTWCAEYALARGAFDVVGFSDLTDEQRARLPPNYEECVHLLVGDRVYSCGAATEEVLARLDSPERFAVTAFRVLPEDVRRSVREPLYRWVAGHRDWWGRVRRREPPAGGRGNRDGK